MKKILIALLCFQFTSICILSKNDFLDELTYIYSSNVKSLFLEHKNVFHESGKKFIQKLIDESEKIQQEKSKIKYFFKKQQFKNSYVTSVVTIPFIVTSVYGKYNVDIKIKFVALYLHLYSDEEKKELFKKLEKALDDLFQKEIFGYRKIDKNLTLDITVGKVVKN